MPKEAYQMAIIALKGLILFVERGGGGDDLKYLEYIAPGRNFRFVLLSQK